MSPPTAPHPKPSRDTRIPLRPKSRISIVVLLDQHPRSVQYQFRIIRKGLRSVMARDSMQLRGADVVARALERAGARTVFTLSGNHIMPIFDAVLETGLRLVHCRHEAAAVHMADAWARVTGACGVALVTGGPGHANAVPALYTALAADRK